MFRYPTNHPILPFLAIIEIAASATGPLEELDTVEEGNVDDRALQKVRKHSFEHCESETYSGGISLAAVGVAVAVAAEDLNSAAQEAVAADLVVLSRADGVVATAAVAGASLDVGGSSNGSGGHGEDGDDGELHFEWS